MRFLFLTSHLPYPANCGDKIATLNTIKGLLSNGHSVDVLSLYNDNETENEKGLFDIGVNVFKVKTPSFFYSIVKGFFKGQSLIFSRFFSEEFLRIFKSIEHDYDYVFSHHTFMGQYFCFSNHEKTKKILDVHVLESYIMEKRQQVTRNFFLKWLYSRERNMLNKSEVSVFNHSDFSFSYGEKEVDIIKSLGVTNIKYRPVGLDFDSSKVDLLLGDIKTLAFFGDFKWYPNLDGLIYILKDFFPKLLLEIPELKLIVAGRNAPDEVVELMKSSSNVEFHGEVPDISEFLSKAGIVLCPIRVGGGVRLKVVESLANGKVVIANDISAEGIIDKNALLVAEDFEATVNFIRRAAIDDRYRKTLSLRALNYANSYHSIANSTNYLLSNI